MFQPGLSDIFRDLYSHVVTTVVFTIIKNNKKAVLCNKLVLILCDGKVVPFHAMKA
jgi:hypothetical protein